jgi:hydroxysqualene synthase
MNDFPLFTTMAPPRPEGTPDGALRTPRIPASLMPKHLRPHLTLFYRFVQVGHRIADDPDLEPELKQTFLDALDRALTTGQERSAPVKPALELRASLAATGVSDRHARQVLRALRRDANGGYCHTWADLLLHCRNAAAPIGRYLLDLHGEGEEAGTAIDPLCTAMRLMGLVQAARADWVALGRCHLPLAWFDEAGISVERLVETRCDAEVRGVFDRILDHADALLAEAGTLPRRIRHDTLRLEVAVMLEHARALSRRLRRRDPLRQRVTLPPHRKLIATARGLWRAMRRR